MVYIIKYKSDSSNYMKHITVNMKSIIGRNMKRIIGDHFSELVDNNSEVCLIKKLITHDSSPPYSSQPYRK